MRFSLSDILAVGIGAAVITTFSYLYYADVTARVNAGAGEVVGTVTYKRKTAERKYPGQVVWEDVDKEVPLYNNDSIRTADLSEAVIHLNDGTEIKMNENSMILLALGKDQFNIEFSGGSIQASREGVKGDLKQLNIKTGDTRVSIGKSDKSDIKLSQSKAGDLSLKVEKGSVNLDTDQGLEKLGTDKQVVISKDSKEVREFELAITLVNPAPDSYHVTNNNKQLINFSWQDVKKGYDVFFELSGTNSFDNIVQKKKVNGNSLPITLSKGIYYWRVRAVNRTNNKQEFSETRRLTVLWDEPVFPVSPSDKEQITYRTSNPLVDFKWTKSEIATGYRLVIAGDTGFKQIISQYETSRNNIVLDSLGKGVYYWRIEKITGLSDIPGTSPSKVFKLSILKKETVSPPEPVYPNNGKQFSRILLEKQNITFTWKNNPDIPEYELSLARDNKFKDIIVKKLSRVNFLQLENNLPDGRYYWRVTGKLDKTEYTAPSPERMLRIIDTEKIRLILPRNNAVLAPRGDETSASIRFSWKRSEINGKYKLQISNTKDFSTIYKEPVFSFNTSAVTIRDVAPGSYFWRVLLLDEDGSVMADSDPEFFSIRDILAVPEIISPKEGYAVNMSNKDVLSLRWNKVNGANLYKLSLYYKKEGRTYKIADTEQKETSFIITDLKKLDIGDFYWTLQALETADNNKEVIRTSQAVKTEFKITLGKPMEKADVDSIKIENL